MSTYHFKQLVNSLLLMLLSHPVTYASMQAVGVVKFSRGVVAAQQDKASLRLLAKNSDVFLADNIQTSEKSFAIIAFTDGGEVTIRPKSSFSITRYINKEGNKQATFDLYKGGVRINTGGIAKKSLGGYEIKTKQTTIRAQQADYSVRLCQKDCMQENADMGVQHKGIKTNTVVARVVQLQGQVFAKELNHQARNLSVGASLYSSDRVISRENSFALLVFSDASRMTLQENSELEIQHYQYQKHTQKGQAIYNLITGGLRVLTGKIGKVNQHNYRVNTPVATIGIRGTGFDLLCQGKECRNKNQGKCLDRGEQSCRKKILTVDGQRLGLHSYVWDSTIIQKNKTGIFKLSAPHANYIASQYSQPQKYLTVPDIFRKNLTPRPDKVKVDGARLFNTVTLRGTPTGVYVTVHKGHVQLTKKPTGKKKLSSVGSKILTTTQKATLIDLGRDEVAYINTLGVMVRLNQLPHFQITDPYLLSRNERPKQLDVGVYSLLSDQYQLKSSNVNLPASCVVQ